MQPMKFREGADGEKKRVRLHRFSIWSNKRMDLKKKERKSRVHAVSLRDGAP